MHPQSLKLLRPGDLARGGYSRPVGTSDVACLGKQHRKDDPGSLYGGLDCVPSMLLLTESDKDEVGGPRDPTRSRIRAIVAKVDGSADNSTGVPHGGPDTEVFATLVHKGI